MCYIVHLIYIYIFVSYKGTLLLNYKNILYKYEYKDYQICNFVDYYSFVESNKFSCI